MKPINFLILFLGLIFLSGCTQPVIFSEPKANINQLEKMNILEEKANLSWWKPEQGISWQWQLTGKINSDYDVDVYDIDLVDTSQAVIDELHQKGIKVVCYFSAGTVDKQRADAPQFPAEFIGKAMVGWPDEKWLDISNYPMFSSLIKKRLDLAVKKKCDGIEPDNVDAYQNNNGFSLTYQNQLEYNRWLAKEAHQRGLSIALKNDLDQIEDLIDYFDLAINEQCFEFEECEKLMHFIKKGKPVLGVEYELEMNQFCNKANKLNFSWLKMDYELAGKRISCQ